MGLEYVMVRFDDGDGIIGKLYSFKTLIEVEKGDTVVVDTVNGLKLVTVVLISPKVLPEATKYVVAKVDLEEHKAMLETHKEAEKIKALMERRKQELEEMQVYEELAKHDKEIAKLLEDYKLIG